MPGWTSRWGRGPRGQAQDDQETFEPGAGVRSLSPAVAVVGSRPDGALACRPQQARRGPGLGRSHLARSTSLEAQCETPELSAKRGRLQLPHAPWKIVNARVRVPGGRSDVQSRNSGASHQSAECARWRDRSLAR
jgi:hypothetical protein